MASGNTLHPPDIEELKTISDEHGFNCDKEELQVIAEQITKNLDAYKFVEEFELPLYTSSFGSTREFCKPSAEDNKFNAWYVKCNIAGNENGKLSGKKIAIKDNTAVANIPMMNGSALMEGYIPEYDATVVQRILQHGGNIVGKTTCEDMCFSGASYMTKYGPVRNPKNTDHSAGGSSSGSGVVVSTGEVDMAIGGDQGGSIRIPASNCGIVGIKPTHGLVPYTGAVPIVHCLDHLGPMARSVADCALLLECIAGYDDERDYRQNATIQVFEYSKLIYPHLKPNHKIKIGVLTEGVAHCDDNVKEVFLKSLDVLRKNELLDIGEVSIPLHADASKAYFPVIMGGVYGGLMGGYLNGYDTKGLQSHSMTKIFQNADKSNASINTKLTTLQSTFVHNKTGNFLVSKAKTICLHICSQYNEALKKFDVLVMPTLNKTACKLPSENETLSSIIETSLDMILNTAIFDITGHPALSLNCGYSEHLPVGFQIVGKHYDEIGVLNCASIIEEAFKGLQ